MSLPLIKSLSIYTDENGAPFTCPEGLCSGSPLAMSMANDRTWRCDQCGAKALSWVLSSEHISEKSGWSEPVDDSVSAEDVRGILSDTDKEQSE